MGDSTGEIDTAEMVGGVADGVTVAVYPTTPRVRFPTAPGGGISIVWVDYADTGRRTAEGRRVFAPEGGT